MERRDKLKARADTLTEKIETCLNEHVAQQLGKPLVLKHVFVVDALPKTRSGRIVRSVMTKAFLGQPTGDLSSIDNPQALEAVAAVGQKFTERI
jgi:acetyl-CoA synthetase